MHCNLRTPDVAPVDLSFNCEAHNTSAYRFKSSAASNHSTYPFLTYNVFTVDTLRHDVTFDPLTLNVRRLS